MTAFAALAHNEHLAAMISKAVMLAPVSYIGNIQSKLAVAAAWLHVDDVSWTFQSLCERVSLQSKQLTSLGRIFRYYRQLESMNLAPTGKYLTEPSSVVELKTLVSLSLVQD